MCSQRGHEDRYMPNAACTLFASIATAGSHYTNVYSSWTSFRWRMAPLFSRARVHIFTAIKYIGHLTAKLEVISVWLSDDYFFSVALSSCFAV